MSIPKVSILVPIYNVEKYLEQCLDSVVNQTLEDIEIICLNDGSTDGSLDIIKKYAKNDKRIVIVDKKNSGYGDSMNLGLSKATGKYVGIVESDDFIELDAFEKLYALAENGDADVARANFYEYRGGKNKKHISVDPMDTMMPVCPRRRISIFYQQPAIWAGIYRRDFLTKNKIDFLPTPGASYQDAGFNFKVWAMAERVVFTEEAFLHYRLDNEASSVNNPGKVFCVCDEYDEVERYLHEHKMYDELAEVFQMVRFGAYHWNILRLAPDLREEFIERTKKDFLGPRDANELNQSLFPADKWELLNYILDHDVASTQRFVCTIEKKIAIKKKIKSTVKNLWLKTHPSYRKQLEISELISEISNENAVLRYKIKPLEEKMPKKQSKSSPLISIIVTSYNSADYLPKCLKSLTSQTYENIEIICVNDASPDNTEEVIDKWIKKDKRIHKINNEKNKGLAASRNVGIDVAKGDFIMFCDADDFYEPTMCEEMLRGLLDSGADIAACETHVIYEAHREMRYSDSYYYSLKYSGLQTITNEITLNTDVSSWDKIYRKALLDKYNIRFPDGLYYEDAYFYSICMRRCKKIFFINKQLHNYVRHKSSIMSNTWSDDKSKDYAIDHLHIAFRLYDYLENNNLLEKGDTLFWRQFISFEHFALDNSKSRERRKQVKVEALNFVQEHQGSLNDIDADLRNEILSMNAVGLKTIVRKLKSKLIRFMPTYRLQTENIRGLQAIRSQTKNLTK